MLPVRHGKAVDYLRLLCQPLLVLRHTLVNQVVEWQEGAVASVGVYLLCGKRAVWYQQFRQVT